jgi:hypothetical protein
VARESSLQQGVCSKRAAKRGRANARDTLVQFEREPSEGYLVRFMLPSCVLPTAGFLAPSGPPEVLILPNLPHFNINVLNRLGHTYLFDWQQGIPVTSSTELQPGP